MVNSGVKSPADAAAAVGAEIYVVGQYFPGTPAHVDGAAYRVATDERIGDFAFDVTSAGGVPNSLTFASIVPNRDAPPPQIATSPPAATSRAFDPVVVPRGTIIVVAMDHQVSSYSAASREPISYTVAQDVIVDGHVIAKAGDEATGLVLEAQQGNQGGPWGIGWKAANLRVDVEEVHNFCGDAIPMSFIRSEYRRRQGLFGSHQDLEIIKGQKYLATVARTTKVCGEPTSIDPPALPSDALRADDATPSEPAQSEPPAGVPQPSAEPLEQANGSSAGVLAPPPHWIEKHQTSHATDVATLGYWTPIEGSSVSVVLAAQSIPDGMSPSEYADLALRSLRNAVGAQNVRVFKTERICYGKTNGWYLESITPGASPIVAEQTMGILSGTSYIATYRRPADAPENADARRALDTLCPT